MIDQLIELLIEWDTQLLLLVNNFNHVVADPIIKELSGKWIWVPMYIAIIALFIYRFGWKRGLIFILAIVAAVALSDFVTAKMIRPFFERLRPAHPDNPISAMVHIVDNYRGGHYGFPSCHAANSFALAVSSSFLLKLRWYTIAIFLWAFLQCYTRIYLGVHYPGDILVGACLGSLIGYLAYFIVSQYPKAQLKTKN